MARKKKEKKGGKLGDIISAATGVIAAVDWLVKVCDFFHNRRKDEADAAWEANSCSVTWNTESDGNRYHGFSYHASGESLDCEEMSSKSDIMLEVEECTKRYSAEGAPTGCCKTTTSPGRWELRVSMNSTADPTELADY
ncbi:uncharacterized protein B0J16DRAFT_400218 [Fusarium flagelliforme]|uniref:uncharacterized protein n=1 Tax=Fusarium flagelliforme TaxID=2675880 RepID=UPI001E8E6FC4|nr:uncharacterized protein B0J16DRAFT_400218 [Fusarium flagelliforme]KAH7186207.1 hypothetical protein B0J16DRAFT_400218 [Fusarium flagelliforme]